MMTGGACWVGWFALFSVKSAAAICATPSGLAGTTDLRVIPVPHAENVFFAWQEEDSIYIQDACENPTKLVEKSQTFLTDPSSGLQDATYIDFGPFSGSGQGVVAWVWNDHIYVDVSNLDSVKQVDVHSASGVKSQVRLSPTSLIGTFLVSWFNYNGYSSDWFVRDVTIRRGIWKFGQQQQVVKASSQSDTHLLLCGSDVWAVWLNSNVSCTSVYGECNQGPYTRSVHPQLGEAQELPGVSPLAATLTCDENGVTAVLWLEKEGSLVKFQTVNEASAPSEQDSLGTQPLVSSTLTGPAVTPNLAMAHLVGYEDYAAVITNDEEDSVSVQLVKYRGSKSVAYPRHKVSQAARVSAFSLSVEATKPSLGPSLLLCVKGVFQDSSNPCALFEAEWLKEDASIKILVRFAWAAGALFVILVCMVGHQVMEGTCPILSRILPSRFSHGPLATDVLLQRLTDLPTLIDALAGPVLADLSETRQKSQLSSRSWSAKASVVSVEMSNISAHSGMSRPDRCPICKNECGIRLVFERCGHTACRDCAVIVLQSGNRLCCVCDSYIYGMMPVYL
uniref:RING-type domain-containing protein n=1 Tax=Noctiluca scintillans TaxID=2966 RepID=A0A7S0ZTE6_NOCSC|mmetsp:Transcript_18188/g.48820  ORF Transcript_18188/g.48820 Transcript_18188/m.48820 type:complete len:563 (+) Transcript_18188:122-1810(+)